MSLPLLMFAAALALGAIPGGHRDAAPWQLRADSVVAQPLVRLADLLVQPSAVDRGLQATVLAAAPQPGTPLRWNHAQVENRIAAAGLAPEDFAIPPAIEIHREARSVTAAEVQTALTTYLRRPAEAMTFVPPLTTVAGDVGLAVTASRPDLPHGRLVLTCRAANDPELLPFTVTVPLPAAELSARRQAALLPANAVPAAAAPAILVQPGRPAQWLIANTAYSLTSQVMPLQAGRAGQIIRAVNTATHAPVRVRVVGKDQVASVAETDAEAFHAHAH